MDHRALVLAMTAALLAGPAAGQVTWDHHRPDAHAPVGVEAGVFLEEAEVMVGLRYGYQRLDQLRTGTGAVTADDAFALGYTRVPRAMNLHDYLLSAAYAPTQRLTVLAEVPYLNRNMAVRRAVGPDTAVELRGPGAARAGALWRLVDAGPMRAQAGLMVALPTGGAGERDATGSLAYALQRGSGAVGLSPGLTVTEQEPDWSWGVRAGGTAWLGGGGDGFRPGNSLEGTAWAARRMLPGVTGSVRVAADFWGDVRDDATAFPASPAAEPGLTGGQRVEVLVGANLFAAAGIFHGHRLHGELGFPLHQKLDGPQLGPGWRGTLAWSWLMGRPVD